MTPKQHHTKNKDKTYHDVPDNHSSYISVVLAYYLICLKISYLKDKGIEPTWGSADLGNSFRSEIRDPDGLQVELREWK